MKKKTKSNRKNFDAVALGRKGGNKRALVLSAARRKEIARLAAKARWDKEKNERV